jgi:hypothetical protein
MALELQTTFDEIKESIKGKIIVSLSALITFFGWGCKKWVRVVHGPDFLVSGHRLSTVSMFRCVQAGMSSSCRLLALFAAVE